MTRYLSKILQGSLQVSNEIGNTIVVRLYVDGGVADLTTALTATLKVQFSNDPRNQKSFPMVFDVDRTSGLVSYTPVLGDFEQPPIPDPMYPNINGQVVLTFTGGQILDSSPFCMETRVLF